MGKMWELITRGHIGKGKNSWKSLGIYLNRNITIFEPTKAFIEVYNHNESIFLREKIEMYNKKNNTDFNIEVD